MHRVILVVSLVLFVACVVACGGGAGGGTGRPPAPEREDRLTLAKYNAVRDGMSYSEAVDVIGFHGEEVSSNRIGGTRTVMYSWKGDFGANMNATFQNDKLVSKAQFGLR